MDQFEKQMEERITERIVAFLPQLVESVVIFLISVIVFRFVWGWVIPDLFSGAIDQGLIVGELSWATSFKLGIFVAAASGFYFPKSSR